MRAVCRAENRCLAHEIVSRIEKGDWTAREVVEAYISQAAKAHIATNCLTEGESFSVERRR